MLRPCSGAGAGSVSHIRTPMPPLPPPQTPPRTPRRSPEPDSTSHQPEDADEGGTPSAGATRLSAKEIHEVVLKTGEEELERPVSELAWSGLAAGLTMGFSLLAGAYLGSLVEPPLRPAMTAVGYPLGFIFVVLARSQLFTENTLFPVIPLLQRKDGGTLRRVLLLWSVVLAANLVGALLFALVASRTTMLDVGLRADALETSRHATDGAFGFTLWRAVFGGWLVALMAWLVSSTRHTGAQIALVWLATAPISAFGFRHSIAGAVEAFYRALSGDAEWGTMLGDFLVPAIIGNVIGGVTMVALLNHAQVKESKEG